MDLSSQPLLFASSETKTAANKDMITMSAEETATKREVEKRSAYPEKVAGMSQLIRSDENGMEIAIAEKTTPKILFSKILREAQPRSSARTGSDRTVLVMK